LVVFAAPRGFVWFFDLLRTSKHNIHQKGLHINELWYDFNLKRLVLFKNVRFKFSRDVDTPASDKTDKNLKVLATY